MWFEGSDTHVAATLLSNERDRIIDASFFFEPKKCPKKLAIGDKVRLIGTRLQMWKGDMQLTGKNIQFGHSCISMSLTDAIEAWKHVKRVLHDEALRLSKGQSSLKSTHMKHSVTATASLKPLETHN
jgi:hypothetical protein